MAVFGIQLKERMLRAVDLHAALSHDVSRLPYVMRVVLENTLRHGAEPIDAAAAPFRQWLRTGTSDCEIPFYPSRVLMHDTTCVPALVDIAAMRDEIAEYGGDPSSLTPRLRVDVSVDHSVAVDRYASPDALSFNMRREIERNSERYRLMKWAAGTMPNVRVYPPGTGIMHTINLEQLATVITVENRDGVDWAVPDTLIGTDSHTPMINGIGVLAWGVGGLEAESVLFGMPVMLRLPDVVGVKLTGCLRPGVLATDLALAVTHLLRRHKVSGEFVEFFGPGVSTLTAGARAVIANMAPEYGASTGFFAIDAETIRYLRETGRDAEHCELVEKAAKAQGLWFDPDVQPVYTKTLELRLSDLMPLLAGPKRPQDTIPVSGAQAALEEAAGRMLRSEDSEIPDGAVAIAAITSCTNTSDPRLLIAAGLLARKARSFGLKAAPWVKTSLAPGSPAAGQFLERSGLLADLEALGFGIVGYGCTTCIGNSGQLSPNMERAVDEGTIAAAVISGNRNFPGRIHPSLQYGFLASPPLVIAFAIAGRIDRDVTSAPIGKGPDGRNVCLADIWPDAEEIERLYLAATNAADFAEAFAKAEENAVWHALEAPQTPRFPWDPTSTYLRRPPFASLTSKSRLGRYQAQLLLVLGDDITTDHISPAGQIKPTSVAGRHLVAKGDPENDLNVYAARRGNWEVMVRGLFDNRSAFNLLLDGTASMTINPLTHQTGPLWETSQSLQSSRIPVVIVAGERYGAGSSRDWAAKGVAMLGVKAVFAQSFERIHRSNLIGMGILPILLSSEAHPNALRLATGDLLEFDAATIRPRMSLPITLLRADGTRLTIPGRLAVETALEVKTLECGGIIPLILGSHLENLEYALGPTNP
ncbi:aconitate hydratase AcnA [Ensifer aridi]|uniref:aconitate hydratase AcnA n=1 Tax=Ensifer aridi TaxID=1708715 RepID=UPI000A118D19|nr:aconitate hydratase AcnA [Ensifer aridi]